MSYWECGEYCRGVSSRMTLNCNGTANPESCRTTEAQVLPHFIGPVGVSERL